jgi:hypothetical protein
MLVFYYARNAIQFNNQRSFIFCLKIILLEDVRISVEHFGYVPGSLFQSQITTLPIRFHVTTSNHCFLLLVTKIGVSFAFPVSKTAPQLLLINQHVYMFLYSQQAF